ncbi:MAG: hopanoid biosynthesis associated radical SAM protein HpnH [Verrucomicrobia bacterium]|nr:MAG: hopanoid biosynthesis associated radical SAM protein HpnH [Verrucomicrobiota bacterium]
MRFPLALTAKIALHILVNKLRGKKKFSTVLQLEPLHTCNLTCTGCGRIREYSTSLKNVMSLEDCLTATAECDAPMVSICGGEPLIYPHIEALVQGVLRQRRVVYICTNGMFMRKKMREALAHLFHFRRKKAHQFMETLLREELITAKEAEKIRSAPPSDSVILPHSFLYWNVHLDGLERTHDLIVEREGVFRECILAIRMAKIMGYRVATNTTVYKETSMEELREMFDYLSWLGVDGHTLSPGYDYDAAKEDMRRRLNLQPENFFLTRAMTKKKFADIQSWTERYTFFGTPVYFDFLAGKRELTCSAWAIPTRNIRGWKGPCYLMTDTHHASYQDLLEKTEWSRYGTVNGTALDPRCQNCMVHCGYEPTAALGLNAKRGDTWRNIKFQFGARPPQHQKGASIHAFNGISAGNGHKTGVTPPAIH